MTARSSKLLHLDPMAIALEKRRQAEATNEQPVAPSSDPELKSEQSRGSIPDQTIPNQTILLEGIADKTILLRTRGSKSIVSPAIAHQNRVDESKGYYPAYNDISDRLIPELKLNPFEQSVLNRLYRLSHGWKSEECEVGMGSLAKYCVMSKSQVQRSIASLIDKGLIENLGESKRGGREGNRYKVLPGLPAIPGKSIVSQSIVSQEKSIFPQNTDSSQTIPCENTIKNNNKELINTHTNTDGVRVCSKFSFEECRRYAEHLQSTGQGINNPGGYATTIHRTGEADALIEAFLNPASTPASTDWSQCPDCQGSGFYYPSGQTGGVAKCKHERLRKEGE
jgi:hypothetical protein